MRICIEKPLHKKTSQEPLAVGVSAAAALLLLVAGLSYWRLARMPKTASGLYTLARSWAS